MRVAQIRRRLVRPASPTGLLHRALPRAAFPTGPWPMVSTKCSPSSLFSPVVHQMRPVLFFFLRCDFLYYLVN